MAQTDLCSRVIPSCLVKTPLRITHGLGYEERGKRLTARSCHRQGRRSSEPIFHPASAARKCLSPRRQFRDSAGGRILSVCVCLRLPDASYPSASLRGFMFSWNLGSSGLLDAYLPTWACSDLCVCMCEVKHTSSSCGWDSCISAASRDSWLAIFSEFPLCRLHCIHFLSFTIRNVEFVFSLVKCRLDLMDSWTTINILPIFLRCSCDSEARLGLHSSYYPAFVQRLFSFWNET